MYIGERRDNSFLLVKKRVPVKELKVTENGRLLWKANETVENYIAKLRVSFHEPDEVEGTIQTEHVCVKRSGEEELEFSIIVENQNFHMGETMLSNKIIEKGKGMNCKCMIYKMDAE